MINWLLPSAPQQVDPASLFNQVFDSDRLLEVFLTRFSTSPTTGVDRQSGVQFGSSAKADLGTASKKCLVGDYRFAPFLEKLKVKSRDKRPRLIAIPIIRDRVVLHQLNKYLAFFFPDCVPKNIASTHIRRITEDLTVNGSPAIWVCTADIKDFYASVNRERLIALVAARIDHKPALRLLTHALATPTVPDGARSADHKRYLPDKGIPQGLAISNLLAAIYVEDVDRPMGKLGISYFRYVDDILMYGAEDRIKRARKSLGARLRHRGLSLHPLGPGSAKGHLEPLPVPFGYLGYYFKWPTVTVRDATVHRFITSMAAKFTEYVHGKQRRLDRHKYLTADRLAEIFLLELNEKISGAISEKKRYGWIAYYSQITDFSLLHHIDYVIAGFFARTPEFGNKAPNNLKKLSRAYFEIKFSPYGGYVRNYDAIVTRIEKLAFLVERGLMNPDETLTDEQIDTRFAAYKHRVLSEMQADEAATYQ